MSAILAFAHFLCIHSTAFYALLENAPTQNNVHECGRIAMQMQATCMRLFA